VQINRRSRRTRLTPLVAMQCVAAVVIGGNCGAALKSGIASLRRPLDINRTTRDTRQQNAMELA
jgi:hypothetical protein